MPTMIKLKLKNRGDTIVEVLVAIAVISLVLAGAYVSSSKSVNASRQAQERGEAIKLVEAQLERIKIRGKTLGDPIYSTTTPFCIDSTSNAVIEPVTAACTIPVGGVSYDLTIIRGPLGPPIPEPNRFTVYAKWDRAGGGASREEARVIYRIFP